MKKILSVLLGVLWVCAVSAQDVELLEHFYRNVSDSCVEMSYKYSVRLSGVNNVGAGNIVAQGLKWKMEGNGVEMYCDSLNIWVLDPSLKEVVIEPVADGADVQLQTNPASMLVRLQDMFKVRDSRPTEDGKAVLYILDPKDKGSMDYFNVEISKADAAVRAASFALPDGTLVKIEVSSMKLTPKRGVEDFRPRTVFDSSWIVTDLR